MPHSPGEVGLGDYVVSVTFKRRHKLYGGLSNAKSEYRPATGADELKCVAVDANLICMRSN